MAKKKAYHSNPKKEFKLLSEERILELKKGLKTCKADVIFITAFTSRADFKKNVADIAWETDDFKMQESVIALVDLSGSAPIRVTRRGL